MIGTLTSYVAAPKRARKRTTSLPRLSMLVALLLTLRMILPPCTYCRGTSTPSSDASTTICGVWLLSLIHSCIARSRYGRRDLTGVSAIVALRPHLLFDSRQAMAEGRTREHQI